MKDTQLKYALAAWKELSFTGAAEKLKSSVETALSKGVRTRDIGGKASTSEMTDAVIQAWKE